MAVRPYVELAPPGLSSPDERRARRPTYAGGQPATTGDCAEVAGTVMPWSLTLSIVT
jgi:hypothetical protein